MGTVDVDSVSKSETHGTSPRHLFPAIGEERHKERVRNPPFFFELFFFFLFFNDYLLCASCRYTEFKESAMTKYASELATQNALDTKLYTSVLEMLCKDLHDYGFWSYPAVRHSWWTKIPSQYEIVIKQCSERAPAVVVVG